MAFRINTNTNAMGTLMNLNNTSDMLSTSIQRLSTGLRINTAADDPSGLIASEKYRAEIGGLKQAIANSQDGINYAKTADGALSQVNSLLQTARSLAVASGNTGVLSSAQVQANNSQLQSIVASITRISTNTQFGSKFLLNGSAGVQGTVTDATKIQSLNLSGTFNDVALTANSAATITVTAIATQATITLSKTFATAGTAVTAGSFSINGVGFTTSASDTISGTVAKINAAASQTGVSAVYTAAGGVTLTQATYGSNSRIDVADANGVLQAGPASVSATGVDATAQVTIGGATVNFTGGVSGADGLTLKDKDNNSVTLTSGGNSLATTNATVGQVLVGSAQFQIGANAGQTASLSLGNFAASQLGGAAVAGQNLSTTDLTTASNATTALKVIDAAIDQVSASRGQIGSFQTNVLQTNMQSLSIASTNLTATDSAVRDTDVAAEMTNFTKNQILQQAGISVLAQSNAMPQMVLKLLG